MATKTANYNLIKPDLTDDADIRVINGNMEVLDNQLKSISDTANDVNNKLPLTGGTMTGAIKTTDNIYKASNNGVLVLSGSTDASHGGRINLSGEKQSGLVKITADNGTVSNIFEVTAEGGGSQYNFNGLTTYMNSNDDYFRFGGNDAYLRLSKNKEIVTNATKTNINGVVCEYNTGNDVFTVDKDGKKFTFNENGDLMVDGDGDGNFDKVLARQIYYGAWYGAWVYATNDLLIQGGLVTVGDTLTNVTLPRPYVDKNSYILYVSDNSESGTLSGWAVSGKRVSNTTIGLHYFSDRQVAWLTIGGRN